MDWIIHTIIYIYTHTQIYKYIYIYIYIYTCIHVYIYTHIHTHTHTYIYIYIYMYHQIALIYIYIYIYTLAQISISTHIYIFTYTHSYIYTHIYIHRYTHTHTHIYIHIYIYIIIIIIIKSRWQHEVPWLYIGQPTRVSIRRRGLWIRPNFSSSDQHVLFVLLECFLRWEAGNRTVAVLCGVATRICTKYHAAFLCSSHLPFSRYILLAGNILPKLYIYIYICPCI